MRLKDPVEILYLTLMLKWNTTAPENGKQGYIKEKKERNTQISRMAFILQKIALGNEDKTYNVLARFSKRNDGEAYISKDSSWMKEPRKLNSNWFFEGCTSLKQKQDILQGLTKLNLSSAFVSCTDDFVANNNIDKYFPTEEEANDILKKIKKEELNT